MAVVHLLVGWTLLLGALFAVFGGALNVAATCGLLSNEPIGHLSGYVIVLGLATLAGTFMVLAMVACRVFLFAWFLYLRLLPATKVEHAEQSLSAGMTLWQFEPAYSRMRRRMLDTECSDS